jgi:hypothetical protein
MTPSLMLHLDEFGRTALAGYARRSSGSADAVVRVAALYYLADRDAGRTAWRVPYLRRLGSWQDGEELMVGLDSETCRALEAEAGLQGVTAAELAEHAVLYFLADLDSGRLKSRLDSADDYS